ncbi:hypothetical protein GOBAR_AA21990 [Gossypium barbadense]|uniref:Uncharacterized protein n=1 Tax=Gossypium barbadense TaxID=3634 RepID=A0A2P5X5S2_GOSBA|nr:hypothetical protein GOBAR_AA21990 [Gossypium barbadense]
MKHCSFVREKVVEGMIEVNYVLAIDKIADEPYGNSQWRNHGAITTHHRHVHNQKVPRHGHLPHPTNYLTTKSSHYIKTKSSAQANLPTPQQQRSCIHFFVSISNVEENRHRGVSNTQSVKGEVGDKSGQVGGNHGTGGSNGDID